MAEMRALTFDAKEGVVFRNNYPRPTRTSAEALIRVIRAGICNTDMEIIKGYANFSGVLGHEFLGVVEDIDEGGRITKGQKVTGDINLACEQCHVCKLSEIMHRNHCPNRRVLGILNKDGAFADYITLPVVNLHPVPDDVEGTRAVFAEPLAAAFRIAEQGIVKTQHKVAVLGDGKLGQLISLVVANQKPKELAVFGKHREKLELLPNGIKTMIIDDHTIDTFNSTFDVVVDATGNPNGLKMAMELTRPLGTIVLKSTCALGSEFNTFPIVVKELKVIGSRCGNFNMALNALESEEILPDSLISRVYPFSEAVEALKHAAVPGTMKIQLIMNEDL